MALVTLKLVSGLVISVNPRQVISVDSPSSDYESQNVTAVIHLTDKRVLSVEGSQSEVAKAISKAAA